MAPFAIPYRAPERVLEFEYYNSKVDMWSVGCLFAELVSSKRLFLNSQSAFPELQLLQQSFSLEKEVPKILQLQLAQLYTENEIQYVNERVVEPLENSFSFPSANPEFDNIEAHSAENGFDVLNNLLRLNPEDRWSAEEALIHPFFADDSPRNGKLKNPKECEQVFDDTNVAVKNKDIKRLKVLLQQQINLAPRL